jgi:hypothetical protein
VLVWLLVFIVMHLTLVFATSLLDNLNHVYAARKDESWIGFGVFAASTVLCVVAWVAATPFTLRHPHVVHRAKLALVGSAQRLYEHIDRRRAKTRRRHFAILLAERPVPRFRRVQGTVRQQFRRLPTPQQRSRRQSRRPHTRRAARAAAP